MKQAARVSLPMETSAPANFAGADISNYSLVIMNNGVISKLSNFGRRRSML